MATLLIPTGIVILLISLNFDIQMIAIDVDTFLDDRFGDIPINFDILPIFLISHCILALTLHNPRLALTLHHPRLTLLYLGLALMGILIGIEIIQQLRVRK